MSELALSIVSVANALREGIVLVEDLHDLSTQDDITEDQADAIIDKVRQRVIDNRDND